MKTGLFWAGLIALTLSPAANGANYAYTRTLGANGGWQDLEAWSLNALPATWSNPVTGDAATAAVTTEGETELNLSLAADVLLNGFSLGGAADLVLSGSSATLTTQPGATIALGARNLRMTVPLIANTTNTGTGGLTLNNTTGTLELTAEGNTFNGNGGTLAGTVTVTQGTLLFSGNSKTTFTTGDKCLRLNGSTARIVLTNNAEVTLSSSNASVVTRAGSWNSTTGEKSAIYIYDNAKFTVTGGTFLNGADGNAPSDVFQKGGTVTFNGQARLAQSATTAGSYSLYELSGGKLIHTSKDENGFGVGRSGDGILRITGGEMEAVGVRIPQPTSGSDQGGKGLLELLGGTLTVGASGITMPGVADKASIVFGGGTLKTSASWTLQGFTQITMKEGTVTTFAPGSGHTLTLTSPLPGSGGLLFGGPGTVKLNGANTYTGATALTNGTLIVSNAGGIPAGSDFTVSGGTLDLGESALLTAKAKSLTLSGGTIKFNVLGNASDAIQLQNGALTVAGGLGFTLSFGADPLGVYTLVSGISTFSGSLSDIALATTNLDLNLFTASLALEDNALKLVVAPATAVLAWAAPTGNWSTSAGDVSWIRLNNGNQPSAYANGDFVTFPEFAGVPSATVTTIGSIEPALITFSNASTAYTFADGGDGKITFLSSQITATNAAPVVFDVPVVCTQALTLAQGSTLVFTRPFGTAPTASAATNSTRLVLEPESTLALTLAPTATQALASPSGFSGGGNLRVSGGGELQINTSVPDFSGQIDVTNAVLRLNAATATDKPSGSSIFYNTAYQTDKYPLLIESGGIVDLGVNEAVGWGNSIRGWLLADMRNGSKMRTVSGGATQTILRKVLLSGAVTFETGTSSNWKLGPGAVFKATSGTTTLTQTQGATGGYTLTDGTTAITRVIFEPDSGAAIVVDAPFASGTPSNAGIRKTGEGLMAFKQNFTCNVPFEIEAGRLRVDATAGGTGAYTVSGGMIAGQGTIASTGTVTVKTGAAAGTGLTIANLALEAGTTIAVAGVNQSLTVTGTLAADSGTIAINIDALSGTPTAGKICNALAWPAGAAAPTAEFVITGDNAKHFYLKRTDTAVELYAYNGTVVILY